MAKFTPSAIVGRISGSVHSETYSRNRYGAYVRARTVPINRDTTYQQKIRAILSSMSAAWAALDEIERKAWTSYSTQNPISDALGESQVLTGHAAFVGINSRLSQSADTVLDLPPVGTAPVGLTTLSIAVDVGIGPTTLAFTPTPIGADYRMFIWAAVVNSVGITYIKNLLKLCEISAKNHPTGTDPTTLLQTRFGTLQVGQKVVVQCSVFDTLTGLLSRPLRAETIVVTT